MVWNVVYLAMSRFSGGVQVLSFEGRKIVVIGLEVEVPE
jgi:hypothetical protein